MSVSAWPSQIPFESAADGISETQSYTAPMSSDTEGGPPIMRPRPGPRSTEMPWRSVFLTGEEWQAFEQFARTTLRQGTLPFEMPVFRPGEGFVSRICQLKGGEYSTDKSVVPWFRISFTLVVWDY